MENTEILENENNFENVENMEIYELVAQSINFLTENNNESGQHYLSIATAEEIIPKTHTEIKKFVLKSYKSLIKSNNSIRIMNTSLYRMLFSHVDEDLTKPLLKYFEDEKKCLLTLKKFLNAKIDLPTASFTGVFSSTIIHIHNVNIDKINKILDISKKMENSAFTLTVPTSYTIPENHDLVNNIESTINKILIKK